MKILLVNDDGYDAIGIKTLEEKLKKYGEVYVVGPYKCMSGTGTGVTIFTPIKVHKFDEHHYAVEGTPADCAEFGVSMLNVDFDFVASGINDGLNITYDILHSGTIGACIEALMYGVPAVAFSHEKNSMYGVNYFDEAMEFILKHHLISKEHVVNVNFTAINEYKGIKLAKVEFRNDHRWYDIDNELLIPRRTVDDPNNYSKDSEIYLVAHGYTAISLLEKDFYNEGRYLKYKKLIQSKE